MSIEVVGFTSDVIGKILIAVSVLLVHRRLLKERKIDKITLKEIRKESYLTVAGIILIILGYFLQLPSK